MVPPIASNFIVGGDVENVINYGEDLGNITPIYNQLGEHYSDIDSVNKAVKDYKKLMRKLNSRQAEISVKPSQLGTDIQGKDIFEDNAQDLIEVADRNNIFLWFDMEDYKTIDDVLDMYIHHIQDHAGCFGVCLQANMKRTEDDLRRICKYDDVAVRLVKGAYSPPKEISYHNHNKVTNNLKKLIDIGTSQIDGCLAIGSHDDEIINHALNSKYKNCNIVFQMLKGVREEKQKELSQNHAVAQYVPYGDEWISYTYRRIRERPKNIFLILRSLRDLV